METENEPSNNRSELHISIILWLFWGFLLGLLKMLYSFFPLFNITDVIVFGLAGYTIGRLYFSKLYHRLLPAILPSLILTGWILFNLSLDELNQGTGSGWLISFIVIPASAMVGKILGSSKKRVA